MTYAVSSAMSTDQQRAPRLSMAIQGRLNPLTAYRYFNFLAPNAARALSRYGITVELLEHVE